MENEQIPIALALLRSAIFASYSVQSLLDNTLITRRLFVTASAPFGCYKMDSKV